MVGGCLHKIPDATVVGNVIDTVAVTSLVCGRKGNGRWRLECFSLQSRKSSRYNITLIKVCNSGINMLPVCSP